MRAAGLFLFAVCLTAAGASRAESKFPYSVTVPSGGAVLRSGPGTEFYATDRLAPGTRLSVYREQHGGWLGVRPPRGSFSLVERRQLRASDEPGVGVVLTDDVLACVGSRVEPVQTYVSQVRLRKDELVELLDGRNDEATGSESEDRDWCRIAPPAGEFRWVQAEELRRKAKVPPNAAGREETEPASPEIESPTPPAIPRSSFETDGWVRVPADRARAGDSPTADQAADRAVPALSPETESPPSLIANRDTAGSMSAVPATSAPAVSIPAVAIPPDPAPAASGTAASRAAAPVPAAEQWSSRTPPPRQSVEELELDLSLMVAADARSWQLAELRQRVEANLVRYPTPAERVQARRLLERIAEFEQLHSRMTQTQAAPAAQPVAPPATQPAFGVPPVVASSGVEAPARDAAGVKYDGSGWLVPVHSTTGTAPPFALLDAQG